MYLEVIVETLKQAKDAKKFGADRIELVSAISEGGLTPSLGLIESVTNAVDIPVQVMLRPHGDSFYYDQEDQEVIFKDLEIIKSTNAQGIVFGALNKDGTVDETLLDKVITHKGKLSLTFHRAIDEAKDYQASIDVLLNKSISTILTSGGKQTALEGKDILNKLKPKFDQSHIELLAGKGLNVDNVKTIINTTNITNFHMGSGVKTQQSLDAKKIKTIKSYK